MNILRGKIKFFFLIFHCYSYLCKVTSFTIIVLVEDF
jgi:hypothetical protein